MPWQRNKTVLLWFSFNYLSIAIAYVVLTGYFATPRMACFSNELVNWVWVRMDFILMLSSFMLCELYLTLFNVFQSSLKQQTQRCRFFAGFFSFPISTEKQKIKIYSIGWCFPNWNFLWNWSTNRMIYNWTTEETAQSARFKRKTERHWQQRQGHFSSFLLAYYLKMKSNTPSPISV